MLCVCRYDSNASESVSEGEDGDSEDEGKKKKVEKKPKKVVKEKKERKPRREVLNLFFATCHKYLKYQYLH